MLNPQQPAAAQPGRSTSVGLEASVDDGHEVLTPGGWQWQGRKYTVQVRLAPTLRGLLINFARALDADISACSFCGWSGQDGIAIRLYRRPHVIAELRGLQHRHGTAMPVSIHRFSSYEAREFEAFFPKAWRGGWTKDDYIESPRSQAATLLLKLVGYGMRSDQTPRHTSTASEKLSLVRARNAIVADMLEAMLDGAVEELYPAADQEGELARDEENEGGA